MKISYGRYESDGSSVFTQRISVTESEYEKLYDLIFCEREMNYPNCEKYLYNYKACKGECDIRFPLVSLNNRKIAFLKIPHVLFLKNYKGMERLKTNQNTYIEIQ